MNLFKQFFLKKLVLKTEVQFPVDTLADSIKENRLSLQLVENWIDELAFENSCFRYGVPEYIQEHLNKEISSNATYTDYLSTITKLHLPELNYLEIGVSVGKNFFQVLNGVANSQLTGFDIEAINPVLEKKLVFIKENEWKTFPQSIKKTNSSLKKYEYGSNVVNYISGDIWDEENWRIQRGSKYNLIFSDALHTSEAILFEFEMLVKYDLLANNFAIMWDDLVGEMYGSFLKIIKKYNASYNLKDIYFLKVNGWVGDNEQPHPVGIASTFLIN